MPKKTIAAGSNVGTGLKNSSYYRNKRILFQKNTITHDAYENEVQAWTDYFECWTYANTMQTSENSGDFPQNRENIMFETRCCPELMKVTSTGYRVKFNNQFYDILAVDKMNYQNDTLKFNCTLDPQFKQPEPSDEQPYGGDYNGQSNEAAG